MAGTLEGIRVVDMSRVLAGPWAAQMLADYGADVIKIERPGCGDDTRSWGPPWLTDADGRVGTDAAYFLACNRNKRSLTCNLAHPQGAELVRGLIGQSDIVIENYKPGTLARFGLDAQSVMDAHPSLIYCSVSAYGLDAERGQEPGYDAMMQASAGLMSVTGEPEAAGGRPQKVGVAITDIMAGMYASTAVLAALNERHNSGRGQHIDVPLFDSQVAWLANQAMNYLVGGSVPPRHGNAHPNIVPYQSFATADGELMLAVGNDRQFEACAECLGVGELARDDRFSSNAARVRHREALVPKLAKRLATGSSETWLSAFRERGVPAAPINNLEQVFADPHVHERELVRHLAHPFANTVPTVSNPVRFSETPVQYRSAPPILGEHTEEILAEVLGYAPEKIAALADAGAI